MSDYNSFFDLITRDDSLPPDCDFCLTVTEDCMLPHISPGQKVYVSCHAELCEMDVGVFLYEGRVMCRQWCEDITGALLLLCANPKRESENLRIPSQSRGACLCLGKVLLPTKLPPPLYG